MGALLVIDGLRAGYREYEVLHGVAMSMDAGCLMVLTGPNGGGKTTLLSAIVGTVRVSAGTVKFDGVELQEQSPDDRRARGISYVPEGRGLFPSLTVWENLRVAARAWGIPKTAIPSAIDEVAARIPFVGETMGRRVSTLSGGQQQLVSIARSLLNRPRLLLLDEPSTGLAPKVWRDVVALCRELTDAGCSVLMVEQRLLDVANDVDRYALLQRGTIVRVGSGGAEMLTDPEVRSDYLAQERGS